MPKARKDEITWQVGGYCHLYNRGARQLFIFREPENYLYLLRRAKHYLAETSVTLITYCLMPNHYHFLLRQDGAEPAGAFVQKLFNSYSKAYNKMYGHTGTLFERRYLAKPVTEQTHLRHLCRYIHANPVKDGFVTEPLDWPYSNYAEWVGQRSGSLVDQAFITEYFGTPERYLVFMREYLRSRQRPETLSYLDGF